jgi:excinuclease ABC subunit C
LQRAQLPAGSGPAEGPAARSAGEPGCYLLRDGEDRILYIGKAKVLRNRVRSYFQSGSGHGHSPRIALMVRQVCEIEFIVTDSEAEALALEAEPDQAPPAALQCAAQGRQEIPLSLHHLERGLPAHLHHPPAPLPLTARSLLRPYVDVGLLRRTLALVKRVFPLRQRPQPLLPRPHLPRTSTSAAARGSASRRSARRTTTTPCARWRWCSRAAMTSCWICSISQMERYAERLDFESAARVRDQLQGIDTPHRRPEDERRRQLRQP